MMFRAACLLGIALCAAGFARQATESGTPLEWRNTCPQLEIGALAPEGPSAEELAAHLQDSIAAWQDAGCEQLPFGVRERITDTNVAEYDGQNVVITRSKEYCSDPANADAPVCLTGGVLATTTLYWIDRPGDPRDGEVLEVDLEINLAYALTDEASATTYDLPTVITHELGHMIGLSHSCTSVVDERAFDPAGHVLPSCIQQVGSAAPVMFPKVKKGELRRTLATDELNAICAIYNSRQVRCDQGYHAGCNTTRDAAVFVVPIILLVLLLAARKTR